MERILYILLMLILFSCQKELEFEGGDDTSRIVLNCVLESGEIIEVNLSNSKNILQEPSQYDSIVDATITIKNLAAGGNSSKVLHCPVSIPHPGSRMFCLELGV